MAPNYVSMIMICYYLGVPLSMVHTQAVKWQVVKFNAGNKHENQNPLRF